MLKKCLFPVAGYGTRFLPATKAMPKEMLPVLDTPLIQYAVEEAYAVGVRQMAFVTGRNKRAIEDHFDKTYELEDQISGTDKEKRLDGIRELINNCSFSYTRQAEMMGLGHAVLTGETLIGSEAFGVILADDLCVGEDEPVMAQLQRVYDEYKCSVIALEEVPEDVVHKYGVISGKEVSPGVYQVESMVEKPAREEAPSNLAIIGRYILTPDIFEVLSGTSKGKGGEIQLTDALMTQAKEGKVMACKFKGKRFDCGSVKGFVDAINHFYEVKQDN